MARMTLDEIKTKMLKETPVQWCVYLELVDARLAETGFKTLREFVTTPINKGGIGIPLERARELLDFNPAYSHQAKMLKAKLGIASLAETVPAVREHNTQTRTGRGNILDNSENVKYIPPPSDQGGNAAKYRIAKLKRDHPEIAERMIAGEFKTVAEAERAAGVKPEKRPTYRLVLPLDNKQEAIEKFNQFIENYPS